MAIARFPGLVIDCPDPAALAAFYGDLLGWTSTVDDDGSWATLAAEDPAAARSAPIEFQRVEGFRPPQWPGQDVPQQTHLDFVCDDLDAGEAEVLRLGGAKHEHQPGTSFRVFLDPVGHPFCLCRS
ncbi:VOC family protein [Nocardioides sp.]|uniref:VOC family protein n=1 Tax=Nocardioides sp. TaxID=35761 RepID=UPI0026050F9E|nr:VOC family protein [Nocardioides sp.]